mmetsp:Transcript_56222/g.168323  ORF Transcript_56222/g.168323 Transcript_56222/m.168323 type:complete len:90 (-) Transcript_56222:2246-2515(-)
MGLSKNVGCSAMELLDCVSLFCFHFSYIASLHYFPESTHCSSLSLTGRLLYPIADRFLLHWPELRERYPRSEVISTFMRHETAVTEGCQ